MIRALFCAFLAFILPSLATADGINLQYSARVRPLALAYSILGAEFFATTESGYFFGPTFHHYSESNESRISAQSGNEWGIKFGRIFPTGTDHQGIFIMGNLNYLSSDVNALYTTTQQNFSNAIHLWYEALVVGYQFNSLLFGPNAWDLRLGAGVVYRPESFKSFIASNGDKVPVGIRQRLDPTLEFSVGYVF